MRDKIFKISLILIGIILILFGISQMVKYEMVVVHGAISQVNAPISIGTLAQGEINPDTYGYHINPGSFQITESGNSFLLPSYRDYQMYCINPNQTVNYTWHITFDQAYAYDQAGPYYSDCGHAAQPANENLTPVLYSSDNVERLLSAGAAYIVSEVPIKGWSEDKQRGIWNLRDMQYDSQIIMGANKSPFAGASSYDTEAKNYAEYDANVKNQGLKPTDETNLGDLKVLVDTDTREYIAGPFNIEYTNGVYGNIAFSGISEMRIIGYNVNKQVVRDNIKIEKFILKDKATGTYGEMLTPEYFEPSSDLKVDETPQVYPSTGQDFKVVFKNPNEGIEDELNKVTYISIKVKFKYMLANGKYMQLKGIKQQVLYSHDDTYNPHTHTYTCSPGCNSWKVTTYCKGCVPDMIYYCDQPGCKGHEKGHWCPGHTETKYSCPGHTYGCNGCITDSYLQEHEQQWLMAADAIRSVYEQEIYLLVNNSINGSGGGNSENKPIDNPPGTPLDITMEISGNVWEELKTGKDGRQGDTEPPVSGIPVIIYSTDGKIIKITTTNQNGVYRFDKLDPMKKYYVEFRYNGQEYENTIYTDNLSGGYSNATESKADRDAFNKKFEEINGDEGYKNEQIHKYNPEGPFTLSAFTGSNGRENLKVYPKYNKFTILDKDITICGTKYEGIYEKGDNQKELDFGIAKRNEYDIALKKDLYAATVKVNGKTVVYGYDKKNIGINDKTSGDTWNVQEVTGYDREISGDDYSFAGQNGNNELLEVYLTYKIAVRNQSENMLGHVTKLYDYYDSTYTYRPELSWTSNTNYTNSTGTLNKLHEAMETKEIKDAEWGAEPKVIENKNDRLIIDVNKKQEAGETVYLYLTFKVDGQGSNLSLGVKNNRAEVISLKTYYEAGTILPHYGENKYVVADDNILAGRVDRDSIPSTMGTKETAKEDDEDVAPNVNVGLTGKSDNLARGVRKITGTVWEDARTLQSGETAIGNGIKEDREVGVAGVKVQLIEKNVKGRDCLWHETVTDENGRYTFEGFVAGDYYIRFYYGDSKDTVATSVDGGKNIISYNGQDYKSTSYQVGIKQEGKTDKDNIYDAYIDEMTQNETKTYGYNITESEKKNVSDAKDIWSRRQVVNSYSTGIVKNELAEILASPYQTPKYNGHAYTKAKMDEMMQKLIDNTYMIAETGMIVVEIEKDMQSNLENGVPSYELKDIDLGLEERPKAQLEIDKFITNVKVSLANGSVLFDANKSVDNVIWKKHEDYELSKKKNSNGKYEEYYGEANKNRYSYRYANDYPLNAKGKGLVQLTMDEEIMHGATIQITYKVKVTNAGEVDYEGQKFYYLGDSTGQTKVKTRANQVVDYIPNNLQFNKNNPTNNGWNLITKKTLTKEGLVNSKLSDNLDNFNIIIQTEGLNKELIPGESTEKLLTLTQLISTENTEDDLTYSNMVEIVKTTNTIGRRMAYSVVGNQHPDAEKAEEIDSGMAEKVIILPPFGETYIIYILGVVMGIILVAGITFTIKKVLKK